MVFVYEEKQFCRKRGNRREVLDGVCWCTSGGLVAADLEERNGKIISKKRSLMGKARYADKNPFVSVEDEKVASPKPKPKRKRKRSQPKVSAMEELAARVSLLETKNSVTDPPAASSAKRVLVPVARRRRAGKRRGRAAS